jgi:DNA-binding LytR/AlgR family response regulator
MDKTCCLIVDDEPIAREILSEYIARDERLVLKACCKNASDAFDVLGREKIDLMFLDISMPGISGINFLKALKNPPRVIFTTAHREFAIDGFELSAVDYLLKPITFDRFRIAVNKLKDLYQVPVQDNDENSIFIKSNGKLIRINFDTIQYIKAQKEYVMIYLQNERYLTYLRMDGILEKLPRSKFFRTHRSFIVSLRHVQAIEGNTALIGDKKIPISKALKADFLKAINAGKVK